VLERAANLLVPRDLDRAELVELTDVIADQRQRLVFKIGQLFRAQYLR